MKNKDLREFIFYILSNFGYKIYDIQNVDGYFLFEGSKDSVTHFRLKGHGISKHWKFGLWLNEEYLNEESSTDKPVIQLFAQYDTQIDKFKPSRSNILFELDKESTVEFMNNKHKVFYQGQLEDMLTMMHKHFFLCYNGYCGKYVGYSDNNFVWEFIREESKLKYKKVKKALYKAIFYPYTLVKITFAGKSKIIKEIELYDFEKENPGWSTDYLYEVRYMFTKEATQKEEVRWLNFWWHRDRYGEYATYHCVISLDDCKKEGHKGRYGYKWED